MEVSEPTYHRWRAHYGLVMRTFQRTIYRARELVQFDLFEPREPVPVGQVSSAAVGC